MTEEVEANSTGEEGQVENEATTVQLVAPVAPEEGIPMDSVEESVPAVPPPNESFMQAATSKALRPFVIISTSYLLFTITDGAIRMIVLLHAYQKSFSALEVSIMFTLYELAGVFTNLVRLTDSSIMEGFLQIVCDSSPTKKFIILTFESPRLLDFLVPNGGSSLRLRSVWLCNSSRMACCLVGKMIGPRNNPSFTWQSHKCLRALPRILPS